MKIPFCKPSITWREKRAVFKVLDDGMITNGPKVDEFEEMFAEYVGSKYAVAVNCCTSALFLSLKYLDVKEGDEVIVPSLTFTASASTIRHCGATPLFCDVDMDTLCLNKVRYDELMKREPKAAVVVLLTGNLPAWSDSFERKVYDSAHLIDRNCYLGGLQCFSFHGTKNMTTGFGGMIATDDPLAAKWLRQARMHGAYKKDWDAGLKQTTARWGYQVNFCGWKMNMNDIQAALGIEQLKRLDWMNKERRRCVERYNQNLGANKKGLHLYPYFPQDRPKFIEYMADNGIQCSIHFEPLHLMPAYRDVELHDTLETTEFIGKNIVSLPLYPTLKNKEIDYICEKIKLYAENFVGE